MDIKVKEWLLDITKKWFPDSTVKDESENSLKLECGFHDKNVFRHPGEYALDLAIAEMTKFFRAKGCPVKASSFGYDYGGYVPAGITFFVKDIWDDNKLDSWRMNCIVKTAIRNRVPYDDLFKISLGGETIDSLRYNTEDGFGIEADDIDVDFQIEAIQYCDCDGNPDDPDWRYELVPCLWWYGGHIKEYDFEGLASTSGLAVGKAIKVIYRTAKKNELIDVVKRLENNSVKWRRYGYCH